MIVLSEIEFELWFGLVSVNELRIDLLVRVVSYFFC